MEMKNNIAENNLKNPLEDIFEGISQKMMVDFNFLTNKFFHSLSTGDSREFVFKEFLRQYLPPKFGIEKGTVISSVENEKPSKQIDVIIYDKLNTPVLYSAENLRLFPIEGVYAVIEIKSSLDSKELSGSISNIRSVTGLTKKAYNKQTGFVKNTITLYGKKEEHAPVLGFVFAYDSINLKTLKDNLVGQDDLKNLENNIDTICVLNNGVITNYDLKEKNFSVTKETESIRIFCQTKKSLLLFYLLLMSRLPQFWMLPIKMTDYCGGLSFGSPEQ